MPNQPLLSRLIAKSAQTIMDDLSANDGVFFNPSKSKTTTLRVASWSGRDRDHPLGSPVRIKTNSF